MKAEDCVLCWTSHTWDSACAPTPRNEPNELVSQVFEAQYPAGCAVCFDRIHVDHLVGYNSDGLLCHQVCPS